MKINWTPEPAVVEKPAHPHQKIAWTLWTVSIACVCLWIAAMAAGVSYGGKVHLLLAAFAVLTLVCILFGFKYVEYLVPLKLARHWITSWRSDRSRGQTPRA